MTAVAPSPTASLLPSGRAACDGSWQEDPGFGIYVHIPFCAHRCHYCDFNTYEGLRELHDPYVDALVDVIARWDGEAREATSVFFGGGTPTLLAPDRLGRILQAVRKRFGTGAGAEITLEANPETVDERSFEGLLEAGFNRFSIGVQSLVPRVLVGLGRTHSSERALEAVRAARRAGAEDVNMDLIFGSPWESETDWRHSLDGAVDAAPDHLSCYALTIEEGTPLHTLVATGRVPDVDPDVQAARHEIAEATLSSAGYERYEVSNWCRPGRASAHNVLYWSAGDYIGFGAGAHSHVAGERWWTARLPRDFIAAGREARDGRAGSESLDPDGMAGEALMLGLRLASGVPLAAFVRRFGPVALKSREPSFDALRAQGLVERAGDRVRLTRSGTLLANEVACRLL